jgi:hypothetical protein
MYFYGKIIARADEGEFYEDVPIITALLEKKNEGNKNIWRSSRYTSILRGTLK